MLGCKTHATIHCKNLTTKMTLAHSDTASLLKTGPETDTHKVRSKRNTFKVASWVSNQDLTRNEKRTSERVT